MKKNFITTLVGILSYHICFAQVQIDKQIQMTGASLEDRQIKNVGDATQATDAVNAGSVQSGKLNYAVATGVVNAFEVELTPIPVAYVPGMIVNFKANNAVTGAATLNINGLGPKVIKKQVTANLIENDILAGQLVSLIYDGSSFQALGINEGGSMSSTLSSIPLFTSSQRGALQSPSRGSIILNTETGNIEYYNGTGWTAIQSDMSLVGVNPDLKRADFIGGPLNRASGFSIGSKIYIGTGSTSTNVYSKSFYEYDTETNIWTKKADFPGTGRENAVAFSIGGKGYLGTGSYYSLQDSQMKYLSDFYEYDPNTDTWRSIAYMPAASRSLATSFVIGENGYVSSGYGGFSEPIFGFRNPTQLKDMWQYNPKTNKWVQMADASQINSGSIGYSVGGYGYMLIYSGNSATYHYKYDPIKNTWSSLGSYTIAGQLITTGVGAGSNEKGYVVSGSNVSEHDPLNNSYKLKNKIGSSAGSGSLCFIINGRGYIWTSSSANGFWSFIP